MKLFIASLLAATVAAQNEISLEEKWRIIDTPTFEYADLGFEMNFSVSEFIIPGQSRATLYTDGCKEEGTELVDKSYLKFATDSVDGILTDVTGTRNTYDGYCTSDTRETDCPIDTEAKEDIFYSRSAQLKFIIDPASIATDGTEELQTDNPDDGTALSNPVYTEDTTGNVTAQVRFCVRYSLYTGSAESDPEVNFLETIVTLDIDLSDGFTVDSIAVAPRDRLVRTAAQAYTCEGYFCDQNEVKLVGDALADTRNQGAAIRVCVVPQLDARTDGVYMRRIDSFTWTRADISQSQVAVANSVAATNGLTTLRCDAGDLICNFETILFAAFYATAGAVEGGGICSMQFGGNGCTLANSGDSGIADQEDVFGGTTCPDGVEDRRERKLRANRYLQNEDAATAEFDLSLDLNQGTGPALTDEPSSASTASMAMAVLAAGAALML